MCNNFSKRHSWPPHKPCLAAAHRKNNLKDVAFAVWVVPALALDTEFTNKGVQWHQVTVHLYCKHKLCAHICVGHRVLVLFCLKQGDFSLSVIALLNALQSALLRSTLRFCVNCVPPKMRFLMRFFMRLLRFFKVSEKASVEFIVFSFYHFFFFLIQRRPHLRHIYEKK